MYSVAKILEMMASSEKRLGAIADAIPRLLVSRRTVNCSWEHKGKVMRYLMADTQGKRRDLVDGVKIYLEDMDGASAILIPDKERPLFHISAEARDQQTADRLAMEYEKKVIKWRDEE
jgi:mannose-1-phosphate guanylyltransferase/phosphomannomutase